MPHAAHGWVLGGMCLQTRAFGVCNLIDGAGIPSTCCTQYSSTNTHLLQDFVFSEAQPVAHAGRLFPLRFQLRSHSSSSIHKPNCPRAARPLLLVLWAVARAVAVAPPEAACGPYRPWGPVLPVLLL